MGNYSHYLVVILVGYWAPKNWCFWSVVLKTLESPLDCKEIQPVHSKGNQPWDFFGRNDAKAEIPVLWPPHAKSWLIGKDSDAGRDWGQEKGTTEDEMAGWHHWLDGRESEWTPGVGDRQGGLACCNSWGRKELDMTERLIWSDLVWMSSASIQKLFCGICSAFKCFVDEFVFEKLVSPSYSSAILRLPLKQAFKITSYTTIFFLNPTFISNFQRRKAFLEEGERCSWI